MNTAQKQRKAFIGSECRKMGREDLAAPLEAGFVACCEAMNVPSMDEFRAAMRKAKTLTPEEIAERNAIASRIVDKLIEEDRQEREMEEKRTSELKRRREETAGSPLTVDEFKATLEKYGYRPVPHGGLWYGVDPNRKNQFGRDYVFAELYGCMYDDGKCKARITSVDGGAPYLDQAQFDEGVKAYSDSRNTGSEPEDPICEAASSVQDNAEDWETCESMIKRVLEYLTWNKYYAVKGHYGHRNLSSDGWFEIEYNLVDRGDPNTSVYLTTYCSSDPSLEQEWYGAGECPVEYNQIEWDTGRNEYHHMAYALECIIECDATRNDLPEEMVNEIVPFLKRIGYLEEYTGPGTQESTAGACCESVVHPTPKWLADQEFVEKVIKYLVDDKGYCISAESGHRFIDSDGWFELEYRLLGDGDPVTHQYRTNVYLTTHSSHDSEFEEHWSEMGTDTISYYDIRWDDKDDCIYALNEMVTNEKVRQDIPDSLMAECVELLKSHGYLKNT